MQRRKLIRTAAVALAGAAILPAPFIARAALAVTNWTAFTAHPPGSASWRGLARLGHQLATATDGAFNLKVQTPGTIAINVAGLVNAVATGAIDLADDPFYSTPVPAGALVRLPMLVNSAADHEQAAAALRSYLQAALARRDVMFLGTMRLPAQSLWSRRPLATMDDIARQRIRLVTPEQAELVRRYGGIPVTLAMAELPDALARGTIDAIFGTAGNPANTAPEPWKTSFAAGYTGYQGQSDTALIANPQAYTSLGRDLQTLLRQTLDETATWIVATRDAEELTARETLRQSGTTISDGRADDLIIARGKIRPYWGEWANPRGRDTVEQLAMMRRTLAR